MDLHARAGIRTVVSACASSTEALVNAYDRLQAGHADVIIAGGSEAAIHPLPIAAFAAMQALSKRNDDPADGVPPLRHLPRRLRARRGRGRPRRRDRGARQGPRRHIYAELLGGTVTSDAYHITAPDPEGSAAARAMIATHPQAGADAGRMSRTSTRTPPAPRSATSPSTTPCAASSATCSTASPSRRPRHPPGTCSAAPARIEALFTVKALADRVAPPTINLTEQDPRSRSMSSPRRARSRPATCSQSATRSDSAATTPSSRSARCSSGSRQARSPAAQRSSLSRWLITPCQDE